MTESLQTLKTLLGELGDLRHAADLVDWDERVCMPSGGAEAHGEMLATLRRIAHEKFTSEAMGRAIEEAARSLDGADEDADDRRLASVTARDYHKAVNVPADYVAEHARVVSAAQHAWAAARGESDFAKFEPHLRRIVELKQQYVTFFPGSSHSYDPLLDDYEPGMTTAEVVKLFDELRPRQVALIRAISERPRIEAPFLSTSYPESGLWDFATEVVTAFGFDWNRGRRDKSVHPFATGIGAGDVRITTRFVDGQPFSHLFGAMHETGHALYEQGVRDVYQRMTLEGGASLGVHESQSRLWENFVGRSWPFWQHFFPPLQARFPTELKGVTADQFYRAINKVEPSLIRVEADEATYNLHVMLRVELEIGLVDGRIPVGELPEIWNAKMREYLGVTPQDDAHGVLQDIHWSAGLFGYFATYTLGNVIAAQLWNAFGSVRPTRDEDIRTGNFAPLLSWLRSELHQYGRKYQPQELVKRVTGSPVDPNPYLDYLERKYKPIYGL